MANINSGNCNLNLSMLVTELYFVTVYLIKLLGSFGNVKYLTINLALQTTVYLAAVYYKIFPVPKGGRVMHLNK